MTVHGAKGLEAPIVFLPDTGIRRRRRARHPALMLREVGDAGGKVPLWPAAAAVRVGRGGGAERRHSELRAQEYRRLLYVAMTRARDGSMSAATRRAAAQARAAGTSWRQTALKPIMARLPGRRWLAAGRGARDRRRRRRQPTAGRDRSLPGLDRRSAARPRRRHPAAGAVAPQPPGGRCGRERVARGADVHRILQLLPELAAARAPAADRAGWCSAHGLTTRRLADELALDCWPRRSGRCARRRSDCRKCRSSARLGERPPDRRPHRPAGRLAEDGILVARLQDRPRRARTRPEAADPAYLAQMAALPRALAADPSGPAASAAACVWTDGAASWSSPTCSWTHGQPSTFPRPGLDPEGVAPYL